LIEIKETTNELARQRAKARQINNLKPDLDLKQATTSSLHVHSSFDCIVIFILISTFSLLLEVKSFSSLKRTLT